MSGKTNIIRRGERAEVGTRFGRPKIQDPGIMDIRQAHRNGNSEVSSLRNGAAKHIPSRASLMFRFILVILLIPLWIWLRFVYRDRIGAFGCFDDCNNIMGGYFLTMGRHLFSQIFFNHMPMMAYISYVIQRCTHPDSIYMLIYQHRMFMIYVSIAADILLTLRFGAAGFGFALLYESTKGFVFGERFLAEGIIIYPVIYLFGLAWKSASKKRFSPLEVLIATDCVWFVMFSREPYIPLVFLLFGIIIWYMRKTIWAIWSVILLALMSFATVFYHGFGDFIFNVYKVNTLNIATEAHIVSANTGGVASIVLYPVLLLMNGPWNLLHDVEAGLVILGGVTLVLLLRKKKYWLKAVFLLMVMILANIRPVDPGIIYYQAFHHIELYGVLIFTVLLLLGDAWEFLENRLLVVGLGSFCFILLCGWAIISPQSYIREKVDRNTEFNTNYTQYYVVGEVIRRLSDKGDTMFLDGYDDLIYWQAKLPSPYRYSWYTSLMPFFPVYRQARLTMFVASPPTFYYGSCEKSTGASLTLPEASRSLYVRLNQNGKPSCLYVLKEKAGVLTEAQLKSVEQFSYSLPAPENQPVY